MYVCIYVFLLHCYWIPWAFAVDPTRVLSNAFSFSGRLERLANLRLTIAEALSAVAYRIMLHDGQ